jgi:hypothetical protein
VWSKNGHAAPLKGALTEAFHAGGRTVLNSPKHVYICHAIREKLMPYFENWPTLRESVGELKLRHSYNNKCCNIQDKFDKPVMG